MSFKVLLTQPSLGFYELHGSGEHGCADISMTKPLQLFMAETESFSKCQDYIK